MQQSGSGTVNISAQNFLVVTYKLVFTGAKPIFADVFSW